MKDNIPEVGDIIVFREDALEEMTKLNALSSKYKKGYGKQVVNQVIKGTSGWWVKTTIDDGRKTYHINKAGILIRISANGYEYTIPAFRLYTDTVTEAIKIASIDLSLYCSCSSPSPVKNQAGGNEFLFCTNCRKEITQ